MKIDQVSPQVASVSKYGNNEGDGKTFLKQSLILATGIFLIIAPVPDSDDIAELTSYFVVAEKPSDSVLPVPNN